MDIEASLRQVLECSGERFADRFYRALFEQDPELKGFFQGVNMQHQAAMLTMALQVFVTYSQHSQRATKDYLMVLGQRHHQRGVCEEDYNKFRIALLATLSEFHGEDWSTALADQWRTAYQQAIDTMLQGPQFAEAPRKPRRSGTRKR